MHAVGQIADGWAAATTIPDVIERMEAIAAALPATDGVAQFNRMYLEVTHLVDSAVNGPVEGAVSVPRLEAGDFLAQLDVVFANLFFTAFAAAEAGLPVPLAWRPLFSARGDARLLPIQFAFAGMNAHIAHDLPIAVVTTCSALGIEPRHDTPQHHDFTAVNGLLAQASTVVKSWFMTGALAHASQDAGRVGDTVEDLGLDSAREAAWDSSEVLWHLRDHTVLEQRYLDGLATSVSLASRGLLI